jgi:hypothetical protein
MNLERTASRPGLALDLDLDPTGAPLAPTFPGQVIDDVDPYTDRTDTLVAAEGETGGGGGGGGPTTGPREGNWEAVKNAFNKVWDWLKHGNGEGPPAVGPTTPPPGSKPPANPIEQVVLPDWYGSGRHVYKMTPETMALLKPLLDMFQGGKHGLDLSSIEIQWGMMPERSGAYTFNDRIIINRSDWERRSPLEKLQLLAHEVTHVLQYKMLGTVEFLRRYKAEFDSGGNYEWPGGPVPKDPVDPRFTLDQIGVSMEKEVKRRYGAPR